jgi:uncharacterized protein YbjT (DUF2867 family)
MKNILVTGATGSLGRAMIDVLSSQGFAVRAAARQPAKLKFPAGVATVAFDYTNPASHAPALAGIEGLVLISPPLDPDAPAKVNPVVDAAKAAGVRHLVMVSAMGVDAAEGSPLRLVERHVMASGIPYTILRPTFFMENFSTGFLAPMVKGGAIYLAAENAKTSFIAVADIAGVAAVAFKAGLVGQEYTLTGPEALDHTAVTALISQATGKPVAYHAIPEEAMLAGMRGAGMPESAVQYAGVLYGAVRAGYTAAITPQVETLLKRKPTTFAAFARQSAGAWA